MVALASASGLIESRQLKDKGHIIIEWCGGMGQMLLRQSDQALISRLRLSMGFGSSEWCLVFISLI